MPEAVARPNISTASANRVPRGDRHESGIRTKRERRRAYRGRPGGGGGERGTPGRVLDVAADGASHSLAGARARRVLPGRRLARVRLHISVAPRARASRFEWRVALRGRSPSPLSLGRG